MYLFGHVLFVQPTGAVDFGDRSKISGPVQDRSSSDVRTCPHSHRGRTLRFSAPERRAEVRRSTGDVAVTSCVRVEGNRGSGNFVELNKHVGCCQLNSRAPR